MTEQEIRERLERYDKARMDGDLRVGVPDVGAFADWMAEELDRQLERSHRLDKELTKIKEAGEPFVELIERSGILQKGEGKVGLDDGAPAIENYKRDLYLNMRQCRRFAQALKEVNLSVCQWVLDEDGIYQTSCDGAWEFTTGNLSDNKVKFCPYCGGQIEEVRDGTKQ